VSERIERLVVFIDVVDSVGLYRRLGDHDAHLVIDNALSNLEHNLEPHGAEIVKRIGDGVLCLFEDCAEALPALGRAQRDGSLATRIGGHFGEVLVRDSDVFGDTVNRAARLAALARGREVLVSEAVNERLPPSLRARCRSFERLRLKGDEAVESLYRFCWEVTDATHINTAVSVPAVKIRGEMCLETPAGPVRLLPGESYRIGRDETCDLVLDDTRVSRFHATLDWSRGRCVLRDHSTNGSYVQPLDQTRPVFIRREDLPLSSCGRVSFATMDGGPTLDFHYE